MDVHTKRNLELTESLRLKDRNYSLLWLLDNTKTAMANLGAIAEFGGKTYDAYITDIGWNLA
jgi:hypothetical protein